MASKTITVKLVKSVIGSNPKQKSCAKGLGLTKTGRERTLENTPAVRGMIKKIIHLVEVKEQ